MQIEPSTLGEIKEDKAAFSRFFAWYAEGVFRKAALFPKLSPSRVSEIHDAWVADLKRVGDHEPQLSQGLDHFKHSGHLTFWIRRFSPLLEASAREADLGDSEGYGLLRSESEFRDFLYAYANEYLAFDLGYQFCAYYERYGEKQSKGIKVDRGYIAMVCHFLKYKSVSPHALTVIYKSLFLGRDSLAE